MRAILKPTSLEAKPDWPEASKKWEAFWNDEVPKDRVLMGIHLSREDNPYQKPQYPENLESFHTDLDFFIKRRLNEVFRFEYLGEAFPSTWNSITGGYLGILLGGNLRAMENGVVWSYPFIDDWEKFEGFEIKRDSKWYKLTQNQLQLLAEHKDKFLTMIPDFHGISDALVATRGAENLAIDLIDDPQRVQFACSQISDLWIEAYDEVYDFFSNVQAGSNIWFGMWHPGKIEAIQEDFAELISSNQYRKHFMPYDRKVSEHFDVAMFHLHNTMLRYQEVTLEMPEIKGTQFRPQYDSNRKPEPVHKHLNLYKRMHAFGKKTWYHFIDIDDMEQAIMNGDTRHLYLIGYVNEKDKALRLLERASELTQIRNRELGLKNNKYVISNK